MDISDVWLLKTNTNHFLTISSRVKIKTILYLVLKHWPCYQKSVRLHQAIGKCNHRPWSWYFDHKKTFEYLRRWWEVVNNISWWRESRADAAGADWLGPDSSSLNAWVDLKVLSGQDNEGRCWLTLHTSRYLSSRVQTPPGPLSSGPPPPTLSILAKIALLSLLYKWYLLMLNEVSTKEYCSGGGTQSIKTHQA